MTDWMGRLAQHYETVRERHPEDPLVIAFDIDGTILDMRYRVLRVLRSYDQENGTCLFRDLRLADVRDHENRIDQLLERLRIQSRYRDAVNAHFVENFWDEGCFLEAHRPFQGVLEVIRWFQLQPRTFVALNTGRPESQREATLASLNELGREWKVRFAPELLLMNPHGWREGVRRGKVEALERLEQQGYRVFAFVDNEPSNLAAVAESGVAEQALLLHADTMFDSQRQALPGQAVSGRDYHLPSLIREEALPRHVELVWRGVNDAANLREFLKSSIRWAEADVRIDPASGDPVLRHAPFDEERLALRAPVSLDELLRSLSLWGRAIKLDLKEGGALIETTLERLEAHGFRDDQLWFNAEVEELGEKGFRTLRERRPGAVIQCPVDFLTPLFQVVPDRARALLELFSGWGIDRFSLGWGSPRLGEWVDALARWGHEVNVYAVPDLESFLRAALLLPRSITSDFDLPHWGYRGRGEGA